jgi:lysophospholipase L1-like esterase
VREFWDAASLQLAATLLLLVFAAGTAQAQLRCGPFTAQPLDPPAPRTESWSIATFERINKEVKTQPYRALFLGDSITERWAMPLWGAKPVWDANMPQRGVLNAGVSGDRTEHLRWRFDHGNLDGPPPKGVIVLIGTNDLAHGRPPELAAEGVRAVLLRLREKLPGTRILLLGLTPRGAVPWDPLRIAASQVNQMIGGCADGQTIWATDIGQPLLDAKGMLSQSLSPDYLHFSGAGYQRLVPQLDPLIDKLLGP